MYIFKRIFFIALASSFLYISTPTPIAQADCGTNYADCFDIGCSTVSDCIGKIIDFIVSLTFPIGVIFIFFAGFKFVTAQGNPSELQSARKILLWTLVGLALVVGAKALSLAFEDFFKTL